MAFYLFICPMHTLTDSVSLMTSGSPHCPMQLVLCSFYIDDMILPKSVKFRKTECITESCIFSSHTFAEVKMKSIIQ